MLAAARDRQMDFIAVPASLVTLLIRPAAGQGKGQGPGQDRCDYFFHVIIMHLLYAK